MPQIYNIKLKEIVFTYHIDKGNGHYAQSILMDASMDVLTEKQQKEVKQKIFETLTQGKRNCILKED